MIRGKSRTVIPVNLDLNAKIHNRFDIEVRDAKTGELKQEAKAYNVICSALWTRMFTPAAYFNYIVYGSGSGTPAASDTTLFTKINAIAPSSGGDVYTVNDSENDSVASYRRQIIIDTETSNGTTITEVGIGYDGTHIVTHAMLQDMNGNPVSIAKTSTDIITIYATMYLHYSKFSSNEAVKISSIYYRTSTGQPDSSAFAKTILGMGSIGNINKVLHMSNYGILKSADKAATLTVNSASKSIIYSMRCLVGEHNYERGISVIEVCGCIIMDVTKMFALNTFSITGEAVGTGDGTTSEFNTLFPINSNAKIYVDGVEQVSGITIHTGKDKEFYKLNKFYDENHHLVPVFEYSIWGFSPTPFIVENDRNITFYGVQAQRWNNGAPLTIYGSNDFETWTQLASWQVPTSLSTYTFSEPNNYRFYKFNFQNSPSAMGYAYLYDISLLSTADKSCDIVFSTPPAAGSVITADYIPDCIPKDSDHVFDVTLTISLGEYVGV